MPRLRGLPFVIGDLDDDDDDDALDDGFPDDREDVAVLIERSLHPRKGLASTTTATFDSRIWLKADRMTKTEASLRVAISLLTRRLVASDVSVALTGGELTRATQPRFPVIAFLESLRFVLPAEHRNWRDVYTSAEAEFRLVLHNRLGGGDIVTTLQSGRRFAAEVTGGPLRPTRSPTEHKLLRGTIGRAITSEYSAPADLLVAVVPRSERFRGFARKWRKLPRMLSAGISIVLVDRLGGVNGCAEIDTH